MYKLSYQTSPATENETPLKLKFHSFRYVIPGAV